MSTHAFVDESLRRNQYLICVAFSVTGDLATTRKALRKLRKSGQRRIHFATESDRRRRAILTEFSKLGMAGTIYVADHPRSQLARASILQQLAADLDAARIQSLTIESRKGQDHADRASIYKAVGASPCFEYRHATPFEEPLLWVPDGLAWAYGKGNEWKRLLDRLGLVSGVKKVDAT